MNNANFLPDWPSPWPMDALIRRRQDGQTLHQLTQSRQAMGKRNVREHLLEKTVQDVMARHFGNDRVAVRKQIGSFLSLPERPFPARALPDVTVEHQGAIHIAELKSSRTDYNRFDCVFESKAFRKHLQTYGHDGAHPWEVEQDLIKLHFYKELSSRVGSCLFFMVDAYEGSGPSWTRVFESKSAFEDTMRTDLVKGWADKLLGATRIDLIATRGATARLITCAVHT